MKTAPQGRNRRVKKHDLASYGAYWRSNTQLIRCARPTTRLWAAPPKIRPTVGSWPSTKATPTTGKWRRILLAVCIATRQISALDRARFQPLDGLSQQFAIAARLVDEACVAAAPATTRGARTPGRNDGAGK